MTDIENKILKMEFDNKKFESNVNESLSTIDKLKKALSFKDAGKGLADLDASAKKVSFDSLSNAISGISSQFSALDIIGVTALVNIANSAVNAGKRIIKSLTVEPIATGLTEYETKMNAITTILTNTASKGTGLEDVNAALAELNEYADLTIYNFAEMTRNIGTFTAAGVDLDTSTAAIKGIANLAAGSGSTAQQASTAMYQLSQAISSGVVMLQDWNSVVNAGMGGELFQRALLEQKIALADTTDDVENYTNLLKQWEDGTVTFRNIISDGLIDSETLVQTLNSLSENQLLIDAATQVKTVTQLMDVMAESVQSGWAQSWEYIIGNRDQAIDILTSISDGFNAMVGPSAEARNAALSYWNTWGGRESVIKGFTNIFSSLQDIITPINEIFREFFPRTTGEDLVRISKGFESLTEGFKIAEPTIDNIARIFKGVFAIFDLGVHTVTTLAKGFFSLFGTFTGGGPVLEWLAEGGDKLVALNEAVQNGQLVAKGFTSMTEGVKNFAESVSNYLAPGIESIEEWFKSVPGKLSGLGQALKTFFVDLGAANRFDIDGNLVGIVTDPFKDLGTSLDSLGVSLDSTKQKFKDAYASTEGFRTKIGEVVEVVKSAYTWIKERLMAVVGDLNWDNLVDVGVFGALLLALNKLRTFSLDDLFGSSSIYKGIIDSLDSVRGALESYQESISANNILKIAGAVALLAGSMVLLATIDPSKLGGAMAAMTTLFLGLFGTSGILTKISAGDGVQSSAGVILTMLGMATAMLQLSKAVVEINKVDEAEMIQAANAVSILMASMTASMAAFIAVPSGGGSMLTVAAGILGMAYAMAKLTDPIETLAAMDPDKMWQGVRGISAIFGAVSLFALATQKNKISALSGLGILAVAKAMTLFYDSIKLFGSMDWDIFANGLTRVFAALGAITLNLKLLQSANPVASSIGLVVMAGALQLMHGVLVKYADLDFKGTAKGIGIIALALTAIALPMKLMSGANVIAASIGIGILAGSLLLFATAVERFGTMDFNTLKVGLGTILISLTALGLVTAILSPVIPLIFTLAGGLLLISGAIFIASAGIFLLSAALTALAVSGIAGAAALSGVVAAAITGLALGIVGALAIFNEYQPVFEDAVNNIVRTIVNVISTNIPLIVDMIFNLVVDILEIIVENAPKIVNLVIDFILTILKEIEKRQDEMWEAAFDLFIAFINGFTKALEGNTEELKEAMYDLGRALITAILSILTDDKISYEQFMDAAKEIVASIVEGIKIATTWLTDQVKKLVDNAVEAFDATSDMIQAGKDFVQGFIDGIKSYATNAWNAAKEIGSEALDGLKSILDINSPSKESDEAGGYFGQGFVNGILDWVKKAGSTAGDLGESAMDGLRSAISTAANMLSDDDVSPVITPVLDLTNIRDGSNELSNILGQTSVSASVAAGRTNAARASSGVTSIKNEFTGDFYVRQESDIEDIAHELYKLQVATERG